MIDKNVFLKEEVLVFGLSEVVLLVLTLIALIQSLKIIKQWDFDSVSTQQYSLEKSAYLVVLIIVFILVFKIILFVYFAYMVDGLSDILPGAMCGAGVINSNQYGEALLLLKLFTLFISGVWLFVNREDLKGVDYPFTKKKYLLFLVIAFLIFIESGVDYLYISNIQTTTPVMCCSTIYGVSGDGNVLPFGLNMSLFLIIFYLLFLINISANLMKSQLLSASSALLFLYVGYVSVVNFFGTYVYELPTHKCPFCMLQGEYYYIGYIIWGSLFLGVFFSIGAYLVKLITGYHAYNLNLYSVIFHTIFVAINSSYVVLYYLQNGVFL